MCVVDFDHEVGDRKLQLMRPKSPGLVARRKPMTRTEEEKDVRGLADDELAVLEEWRREWRMLHALAIKKSHDRRHAAALVRRARHIDIARANFFKRKANEFAAPLNCGPIVQLIRHGDQPSAARWSIPQAPLPALRSSYINCPDTRKAPEWPISTKSAAE